MLGLAAGAAGILAGTGLQAYGAQRRGQATQRALSAYDDDLARQDAEQRAQRQRELSGLYEYMHQDQAQRQGAVNALMAAPGVQRDLSPFMHNVAGVQQQAAQLAPTQAPMAGPQARAAQDYGAKLAPATQRATNEAARGWAMAKQQDDEDAAMVDLAIRQLTARRRQADTQQRIAIDRAISRLAWARQQRAAQARLAAAQQAGGDPMTFGALLSQGGQAFMGASGMPGWPAQQQNAPAQAPLPLGATDLRPNPGLPAGQYYA